MIGQGPCFKQGAELAWGMAWRDPPQERLGTLNGLIRGLRQATLPSPDEASSQP
jgi:hypothetical protein